MDGRTDKHARQQHPPRSPPSRRGDVAATDEFVRPSVRLEFDTQCICDKWRRRWYIFFRASPFNISGSATARNIDEPTASSRVEHGWLCDCRKWPWLGQHRKMLRTLEYNILTAYLQCIYTVVPEFQQHIAMNLRQVVGKVVFFIKRADILRTGLNNSEIRDKHHVFPDRWCVYAPVISP